MKMHSLCLLIAAATGFTTSQQVHAVGLPFCQYTICYMAAQYIGGKLVKGTEQPGVQRASDTVSDQQNAIEAGNTTRKKQRSTSYIAALASGNDLAINSPLCAAMSFSHCAAIPLNIMNAKKALGSVVLANANMGINNQNLNEMMAGVNGDTGFPVIPGGGGFPDGQQFPDGGDGSGNTSGGDGSDEEILPGVSEGDIKNALNKYFCPSQKEASKDAEKECDFYGDAITLAEEEFKLKYGIPEDYENQEAVSLTADQIAQAEAMSPSDLANSLIAASGAGALDDRNPAAIVADGSSGGVEVVSLFGLGSSGSGALSGSANASAGSEKFDPLAMFKKFAKKGEKNKTSVNHKKTKKLSARTQNLRTQERSLFQLVTHTYRTSMRTRPSFSLGLVSRVNPDSQYPNSDSKYIASSIDAP